MAARWRAKLGALNAAEGGSTARNGPHELVLSARDVDDVDVDRSILALFDDSAAALESKSAAEEESETLLSALTEMLDDVEDDGRTLSPFDTLPDTKLVAHRDALADLSLAHRLRPRPKPPNITVSVKSDEEKDPASKVAKKSLTPKPKKQSPTLFEQKNRKPEAEIEVFTSTSLVSLVKIMHTYCLKLHAEEGDKPRRNPAIFSQEEVWKYERPGEESNEEINVVSDDEAPAKDTKEEEEVEVKAEKQLKSVLLKGNSPRAAPCRGKKRVSFGPVQVASFDNSAENVLNEKNVMSGQTGEPGPPSPSGADAPEKLSGSAPETTAPSSETSDKKTEATEAKVKSLSLQQYRQLRERRRPLVEKHRNNNTTKWPSVAVPPKELTPILSLQGQKQYSRRPNAPTSPAEVETAAPQQPSKAKLLKPEPKVTSPASPLPESRRSPVKRPTPLSSDPPNPVLLPLPAVRAAPPSTLTASDPHSSKHPQAAHDASSTPEPKPRPTSPNDDRNRNGIARLQEVRSACSEAPSAARAQIPPEAPESSRSPAKDAVPPTGSPQTSRPRTLTRRPPGSESDDAAAVPQSRRPPDERSSDQSSRAEPRATADSGIEAADLTSLLEQFEETQAKEERVCDSRPQPVGPASPSAEGLVGANRARHAGPGRTTGPPPSVEALESVRTSNVTEAQKAPGTPPDLQSLEDADVPEPLCAEVVLSSRQEQPARRKNPAPKAIQIIDPRPLPARRAHASPSESPAPHVAPRTFFYVSSEHDYCGSADHWDPQRSGAKPSPPKDASQAGTELQASDRGGGAAPEGTKRTSSDQPQAALQRHPEQPSSRPESRPSAGEALRRSTARDGTSGRRTAACAPPTPPPGPPIRGRQKRRYRRRSPRSDSSSSSRSSSSSSSSSSGSRSPKRQRLHHKHSESSSCSSSPSYSHSPPRCYRFSYSRSRSRSWSRSPSRSRSPSPYICRRRWRDVYSSRESRKLRREHEIRMQKLKAIDERRVVYVGRIRRTMTHDELRERFSQFGEVECVSLHFRDRGDHYGFVTFYNMDDAFAAIDNGGKLRRPDELPFDICFGGRRQFCDSVYADLDANRDAEASPSKSRYDDLDFDSLLKQAQRGLKR